MAIKLKLFLAAMVLFSMSTGVVFSQDQNSSGITVESLASKCEADIKESYEYESKDVYGATEKSYIGALSLARVPLGSPNMYNGNVYFTAHVTVVENKGVEYKVKNLTMDCVFNKDGELLNIEITKARYN